MAKYGIGQSVSRFEDPRLLRGKGLFVDDINQPRQTYAVLVRSPHAHAIIRSIDTSAAAGVGNPTVSGRDGVETLRVALAALESITTGRTINLD